MLAAILLSWAAVCGAEQNLQSRYEAAAIDLNLAARTEGVDGSALALRLHTFEAALERFFESEEIDRLEPEAGAAVIASGVDLATKNLPSFGFTRSVLLSNVDKLATRFLTQNDEAFTSHRICFDQARLSFFVLSSMVGFSSAVMTLVTASSNLYGNTLLAASAVAGIVAGTVSHHIFRAVFGNWRSEFAASKKQYERFRTLGQAVRARCDLFLK